MTLARTTAAIFLVCNLAGLLASLWLDARGLPEGVGVQTAGRRPGDLRRRLPLILANLVAMTAGTLLVLPLLEDRFAYGWPGLGAVVAQAGLILLVDDAVFYALHRTIHEVPALYRALHRLHHRSHAPVPVEYLYVHPGELALGTLGVAAGVALLCAVTPAPSAVAFQVYVLIRNLHELDLHSGLRTRLGRHVPWLAPNGHHDLHHHRPGSGNYGSMLTVWDRLLGTWSPDTRKARP